MKATSRILSIQIQIPEFEIHFPDIGRSQGMSRAHDVTYTTGTGSGATN
jgi:hypothetical protein